MGTKAASQTEEVETCGGRTTKKGGGDSTDGTILEPPREARLSADSLRTERVTANELRTSVDGVRGERLAAEMLLGKVRRLELPVFIGVDRTEASGLETSGEPRGVADGFRSERLISGERRSGVEGLRGDRLSTERLLGKVRRLELPVFDEVYPDLRLFRAERYSFINRFSDREKFEVITFSLKYITEETLERIFINGLEKEIQAEMKIHNLVELLHMIKVAERAEDKNVVLKLARDRDKPHQVMKSSSNLPFTSVEMDHSDFGKEGCTITTLTATAELKNWQSAIRVTIQVVRRLKEIGVTRGELISYMYALLKYIELLIAMINIMSSIDNLDFIMESDALGRAVKNLKQGHESLVAVARTITLEEVHSVGAKVLEFIADFGRTSAAAPLVIVAWVPKKVHVDGIGETEFKIYSNETIDAIRSGLVEPIDLSNGIPINYKNSKNEAQEGVMRLIVVGGQAAESSESRGVVVVGVRTLSEGGRVGTLSREQVELFCVNNLINCFLESTEEFIAMEFCFALRDNGMRAVFQLLFMVLEHSVCLDDAFNRARQLHLSYYQSIPRSLERSTVHKLKLAMLKGGELFGKLTPKSLQNLTWKSVKDADVNRVLGNNREVSLVGDFSEGGTPTANDVQSKIDKALTKGKNVENDQHRILHTHSFSLAL